MGFGDMIDKAKDLVGGNKEAVKGGIDKAADAADKATGGKANPGQVNAILRTRLGSS